MEVLHLRKHTSLEHPDVSGFYKGYFAISKQMVTTSYTEEHREHFLNQTEHKHRYIEYNILLGKLTYSKIV